MTDVLERRRSGAAGWLAAVAGPAAATGVGLALGERHTAAAALVYLLAVLIAAVLGGSLPGVAASALSFGGLNYFFTPPRRSFSIASSDDLIALVAFVTVALIVGTLVSAAVHQRARAERREYESRTTYAISARLLAGGDLQAVFVDLARLVREVFGVARCEIWIGSELRAADGVAGAGEPLAVPLSAGDRELGRVVLSPGATVGEAERLAVSVLARQVAAALELLRLQDEAREARMSAEAHRVRRALLSAVSHDLRTPLASIKAAVSSLAGEAPLPPDAARELARTAAEETDRLERLVSNLLDLARIRSGALAPALAPVSVEEILEDALRSLAPVLGARRVEVVVRDDVGPVLADAVQMGQVFRNILENAAKYSPPGSEIRITASCWRDSAEVRFADRGPGIPAGLREDVFEEYRRGAQDSAPGAGLGLAVAKAIVTEHGGSVWIESTPGGGATVAVRIPAAGAA